MPRVRGTKRAERAKRLFVNGDNFRTNGVTISRAVRVPKYQTGRNLPLHNELSAMDRAVVSTAQDGQRIGVVITTFGARHHVMNVQEYRLSATRNDTPSSIAPHHQAPHRRRNVLPGAAGPRAHVGGRCFDSTEMLRIAARHLDDVGCHLDSVAVRLVPTAPARITNGKRNLVIGSPLLDRTS